MNLLVVGGGGREHAIIKKLKGNPGVETIYALPGNGGIAADAVCVPEVGAKDITKIVDCARARAVDFAVVAPDDPLALGKGVLIPQSLAEAEAAVKTIMEDRAFGDSGKEIVIEEFLTGPEVSVLAFTDGAAIRPMVSSMDHKRAGDGDTGLNTGGMSTVAPNPYYTADIAQVCMDTIFSPPWPPCGRRAAPSRAASTSA